MLRACCECIFGSTTNESPNGHGNGDIHLVNSNQNSSEWQELEWSNKNMFVIPRSLSPEDSVTITGTMRRHPNSLSISLMTGHNYNIDYQNIACQLEANFSENNLRVKIVKNGIPEVIEGAYKQISAGDLIIDSKFNISFILKLNNVNDAFLDIISGDNLFIEQIAMQHSFHDIGFIVMDGDVQYMGTILYQYRSPIDGTISVTRKINRDDRITLSGPMKTTAESLSISLVTGRVQPDFQNIACQVDAKFFEDSVNVTTVQNGHFDTAERVSNASVLIADSNFNINFLVQQNNSYEEFINIFNNNSFLYQVNLKHNLEDIRFIVINGDAKCITTLEFQLSQFE